MSDEPFLSRWSRRKVAAKEGNPAQAPAPEEAESPPAIAAEAAKAPAPVSETSSPQPLPPVDSLTPESDFAAFMKPEVEPSLKRAAFKKLIEDPRYNVMDGLDVYIDDYSKADPLPEGWLEKMNAVRYLGIFKEDLPQDPKDAQQEAAPLPDAMAEQPVSFPPQAVPPDTSEAPNPPPDVRKSAGLREGN
ncbi:MAG: DUF3306 domain-containing protein [Usitatibacter sp.]